MPHDNPKPSFRYDINALRAIAITGVVLYHFKLDLFAGGFTGVDVFFVISGYLMSRTVINQIDKNAFSYTDYFKKRLHRIVPALLALVTVVAVLCFFLYLPYDYKVNLQNGASSLFFISNIFYWYNTPSYFDASADTNLFLHTWSLSVEWQFYLVYPFLLLLFNKIFESNRTYKIVFIALTLLLFAVSVIVSNYNASFSFYMLPTRSWEMLAGGIAFFAEGTIKNFLWRKLTAVAGYVLIIISFFILTESLLWPGVYTLLPVTGAFFVIIANYNNFIILKQQAVQFIGRISYSLYLWHWPVYVIAQYYGFGTGAKAVAIYCLASVGLGYLSHRYVETVQFAGKRNIILSTIALFAVVFSIQYFNANKIVHSNKTITIANNFGIKQKPFYKQYRKDTCFVESFKLYRKKPCLCFEEGKRNILLIGDSHLAQLSLSLREGFANNNIHFLQATAPATLPTIRSYYNKKNNVRELIDFTFHEFIPKNANRIDGVILSGNWAGQSLVERDSLLYGIKEAITCLKRYNIPVVVIGQTERYTVPYPVIAARSNEYKTHNNGFYLDEHAVAINHFLRLNLNGSYIDIFNENKFPSLSTNNVTYMRDKDHVTKYGADLIVEKIKKDSVWANFLKAVNN
jgi:peptidoglycan/LPS O-acetylase OafA/YrhL